MSKATLKKFTFCFIVHFTGSEASSRSRNPVSSLLHPSTSRERTIRIHSPLARSWSLGKAPAAAGAAPAPYTARSGDASASATAPPAPHRGLPAGPGFRPPGPGRQSRGQDGGAAAEPLPSERPPRRSSSVTDRARSPHRLTFPPPGRVRPARAGPGKERAPRRSGLAGTDGDVPPAAAPRDPRGAPGAAGAAAGTARGSARGQRRPRPRPAPRAAHARCPLCRAGGRRGSGRAGPCERRRRRRGGEGAPPAPPW